MRINKLILHGFKSFADKTVISFDQNFVGVVGPNGSGKSNIIDAIKWVFGEQSSKNLRGDSSTDFIFGGTEKRNKMQSAEVTLVLDNRDKYLALDYDEISITRRLYRSGESEYLINKINCRLKDIIQLITDTGMGKDSFSIVSQGKIEEIVMSKPEKRREVIEQVAGVVKYRKRKESTLRKLTKTDDNIKKVDLVLSEIDIKLNPLKRQKEKAIKYKQLKDDLTKNEIDFLVSRIDSNNNDYIGYKEIVKTLNEDKIILDSQVSKFDVDISEFDDKIDKINQTLRIKEKKLEEYKFSLMKKEQEFLIITDRKANLEKDDEKRLISNKQMDIIDLEQKATTLNEQKAICSAEYEQVKLIYDKNINDLRVLRQSRNNLEDEISSLHNQVNSSNVPYAIKNLKNKYSNEIKTVKDLFTCQEEYAAAITTSIGGRINEVVMNNVEDVKRCIKYLNEHKLGRATFIPLDNVKQYYIDDKIDSIISNFNGFVDYGINLVSFDEKYTNAFNNILATTIVVKDINCANELARKIYNRYRIVTLSGDIVSTQGTISGGKTKSQNVVFAKTQLEKKKKELINLNSKNIELSKEVEVSETNYYNSRRKLEEISQNVSIYTEKIQTLKNEINHLDDTEQNTNEIDVTELENLRSYVNNLTQEVSKLKVELKNSSDQKDELNLKIRNISSQIRENNEEENSFTAKITRLEDQIINDQSILREDYSLSFDLAKKRANKLEDYKECEKLVLSLKKQIKNLGIINIDAINEYDELKERYDFINEQREDLVSAKTKLMDVIDKLDAIVVKKFSDAFYKLRDEFRIIFTELFAGGNADLILTDESDLLNCGVEIVAQPPGKKLQTISLLSGGEKALTAIALLFAILRVRTVPFAILDEVEAALDEANVKRYAKYLSVFSEKTQFIVITHRQGTMEIVDELYGVTMMEKGISSIVKVKLNELEESDV